MQLVWPLTGRSAELNRVDALLRTGPGGVILAGPPGVGKTRLAVECLARAEAAGYAPVRASATAATSLLPFGAFAHLLPDELGGTTQANLLGQVARSIGERGGGRSVAVMVDDAHLLDDSSAALTHQLAQSGNIFVLATLRSGAPASDAVIALWKDGLAERLEVEPLSPDQVEELLAAALGAPMEGASLRLFQERANGNALFLRELVLGALDAGALLRNQFGWRLAGDLPISSRLAEIVESRLASLSEADRRALGVVAVGEPLALETFRALEPSTDIESLESKGLVRVERHDRRLLLRMGHPLQGEVLRAKLSPLVVRRTSVRLAEAVERFGARRRTDVLAVGFWRLEGGGPIRPELMLRAALAARQRNDFALAERLARAAIDAGAGFEAAVLLGQLLWQQRRAREAARHLESLKPLAVSDEQKTLLAVTRIEVIDLGLNDIEASLAVAEEAERSIGDESLRDQIVAERARILGRHGRNATAAAIVDPLIDRAQGRALLAACFAAGTSMSVTGQVARAVHATEVGHRAHLAWTGPPVGFPPSLHLAMRAFAYLWAGYLPEGQELSKAQYAAALRENSPLGIGFFAIDLAISALISGRCRTAVRWSNEAQATFQRIGFPFMERNSLTILSLGQAMQGLVDETRGTLAQLDALGVPVSDHSGPLLLLARGWTEVAANNRRRAIELMNEGLDLARWSGAKAFESWILHDLARLGRASEVAPRLEGLCAEVEGPLAPARARHAAALAARDPGGLEQASQTFEGIGAMLLAAESSADAATVWHQRGDRRKATAAERRSAALAGLCQGARTPALSAAAPVRAALTARELEIAGLAAAGLSDKQIAQRLFLSHRTVENQLHHVYEKLGVTSRNQLAEVLRGL
ncbi:MAG TPA: LuxR C-terminal-related transcriptional regulator [Actinomycetota bacterium]|nr:LuxR C-terminal-related transcriptional regulator [Actinomycetota bacterium]